MFLQGFILHMRARNLSPTTIKSATGYVGRFLRGRDATTVTRSDIESYLSDHYETCKPSSVWTIWRHLNAFYKWLEAEGDIAVNPMHGVPKPVVQASEVKVLSVIEVRRLLDTCTTTSHGDKRDNAIITMMLDTGIRLTEISSLRIDDIGQDNTIRIFGKGRKWRTVSLGTKSALALSRWIRIRDINAESLWTGKTGPLSREGVRKVIARRGTQAGLRLHPHMLRHTFVDNWLRNGGNEVDLARLAGWTSTRMAEKYAQHRASERALTAHTRIAPLDSVCN